MKDADYLALQVATEMAMSVRVLVDAQRAATRYLTSMAEHIRELAALMRTGQIDDVNLTPIVNATEMVAAMVVGEAEAGG